MKSESSFNKVFNELNLSLETKGWFYEENFLNAKLCENLSSYLDEKKKMNQLEDGFLSHSIPDFNSKTIRDSNIYWINNWNSTESLNHLYLILNNLMFSLNQYFRLSMNSFESQFAVYDNGGFYKKHIDKTKNENRRIASCILYLNNCEKGGELVIYNRDNKEQIEKIITPKVGSLVLFFSDQIFHEVKTTESVRHSLTTWFRYDEAIPLL